MNTTIDVQEEMSNIYPLLTPGGLRIPTFSRQIEKEAVNKPRSMILDMQDILAKVLNSMLTTRIKNYPVHK